MFCPTTPILKYLIIPVIKQLIRNLIRNHEKKPNSIYVMKLFTHINNIKKIRIC